MPRHPNVIRILTRYPSFSASDLPAPLALVATPSTEYPKCISAVSPSPRGGAAGGPNAFRWRRPGGASWRSWCAHEAGQRGWRGCRAIACVAVSVAGHVTAAPAPLPRGSRGTARSTSLAAVNSCSNCPAIAARCYN